MVHLGAGELRWEMVLGHQHDHTAGGEQYVVGADLEYVWLWPVECGKGFTVPSTIIAAATNLKRKW